MPRRRERPEPEDWEEFYGEDPERKMDQAEDDYEKWLDRMGDHPERDER